MKVFVTGLVFLSLVLASVTSLSRNEQRYGHSRRHLRRSVRNLPNPNELQIIVTGRDVELRWNFPSQYSGRIRFEVRYRKKGQPNWMNVNTDKTSYRLPSLEAGQTYEFQVFAVTTDGMRTGSTTVEVRIPEAASQSGSYVQAGPAASYRIPPSTMQVRVRADQPDVLFLNWDTPHTSRNYISKYVIYYSRSPNPLQWNTVVVPGSNPETSIRGMATDSKYYAKVETHFRDGLAPLSSNVFQFQTPPVQPIRSVKFTNNPDNYLRLQWFLNISPAEIARTQILYSTDRNLPEAQWRRLYTEGQTTTVDLPEQIRPGTKYYVRLFPEMRDGRVVKSPTVFEIEVQGVRPYINSPAMRTVNYHLKYQIVDSKTLRISWAFPTGYGSDVLNTIVRYTDNRNLPETQWRTQNIQGSGSTATLSDINYGREWWIKLIPKSRSGRLPPMLYHISPTSLPTSGAGCSVAGSSVPCQSLQLCLKRCQVGSKTDCGSDELCVPGCPYKEIPNCTDGWCMSRDLIRAAKYQRI
jgi:hypothetical protein